MMIARCRAGNVAAVEPPAAEYGNRQHPEVPGSHDAQAGVDGLGDVERRRLGHETVGVAAGTERDLRREGRRRDAGGPLELFDDTGQGLRDPRRLAVGGAGQGHAGGQDAPRIETRRDVLKVDGRAYEEARPDEERQDERDLAGDEDGAEPIPAPAGARAASRLAQARLEVAARRAHDRGHSKDEGADDRGRQREAERPDVHGRLFHPGHVGGARADERPDCRRRAQHAERAARQAEHEVLRQELAGDPPARGADGRAHRQLAGRGARLARAACSRR